MAKLSLFKNSFNYLPIDSLTVDEFIQSIKDGKWRKQIQNLRSKKRDSSYGKLKNSLPAVTVSGFFKTRDTKIPLDKKLTAHTGFICIDIDRKDNLKMRTKDLIDKECVAQFVSCSGEGIKIIYRCTPVKTAGEHRRIYDAVVQRLENLGVSIKVDPIVKSIASLQYVSYDAEAYYNPKAKLIVKPLPAVTGGKKFSRSLNADEDIKQLEEYISLLGGKDITQQYEDWMLIMFGLSYSLGERGRDIAHKLSCNYADYSAEECNTMYDACLERATQEVENPITISTVFQIINSALPKVTVKQLAKKYSKTHAVGIGEDVEQGDLVGLVRYKLFLFKKFIDKETGAIAELVPHKLNLNEFEKLLRSKGFYRCSDVKVQFVHIRDNIVEAVDMADILRIITKQVEDDGDYKFTYKKVEYVFSWEEIAHKWREIRPLSTTYNQIAISLEHWQPNLLRDSLSESYVPYLNGVVKVTPSKVELIPYKNMKQQIWKERILPREFKYTKNKGMFEDFFINVCGRGKTAAEKIKSEFFSRALWYFGYMLQGTKRQSTARAWLLYDIKTGNNGRSGKSIIGQAVGKIRSMVTIDGKQIDLRNRFAFQTVMPWTDVVFIDDPSKYMSIVPLFNMISGQMSADKKGVQPVVKDVKFMIASNWILEAEGASESGRQFVTQLDDFYVRYSKENKDTITPIVDVHGKEFFTDWDIKDWSQFDSFCMKALQYHLKAEAPSNIIIGNAAIVRFIQLYEEELFYELKESFRTHSQPVKKGNNTSAGIVVPQQVLNNIVKDADSSMKSGKAGKVVREFLHAIGAKRIEITSIKHGSLSKMAYKIVGEDVKLTLD